MFYHPQRRRGLSLLEIIFVLGLLLFLLAAFLPLLFRLQQRAARTTGANNLRQLGIAVHNYHDVFKSLPLLIGNAQGRHGTILYHLLPFIEQQDLQQRGNVWEAGTIGTRVAVFLDPRDKSAPAGNKYDGWLATTNYAASWLSFKSGGNLINVMQDGTSNTIMCTERYQVCNNHPCAWGYDRIYYWAPMTGYYSESKFQVAPKQQDCDPRLAQALEPEGIHIGLGDGSARMLRSSVSPRTWYHALHPKDGNPLDPDFSD